MGGCQDWTWILAASQGWIEFSGELLLFDTPVKYCNSHHHSRSGGACTRGDARGRGAGLHFNRGSTFFSGSILHFGYHAPPCCHLLEQNLVLLLAPAVVFA